MAACFQWWLLGKSQRSPLRTSQPEIPSTLVLQETNLGFCYNNNILISELGARSYTGQFDKDTVKTLLNKTILFYTL